VVNTCTVTKDADREALKFLRRTVRENPSLRLVVTGCLATRDVEALRRAAPSAKILGNDAKGSVLEALGLSAAVAVPTKRARSRAFLKIQDGCDGACAYCIVPAVRSELWSRTALDVLRRVREAAAGGAPEIVLCGMRLGRYQADGLDLAGLLEALLGEPGDFRFRLSSLEIQEATDRLADIIVGSQGRLCPHLHLPLQSGSETVLKRMNRPHTAEDFARRVGTLRRRAPGLAIFTDLITGFPGETEAEHQEALDFVRGLGLCGLHLFRYSARPGTPAADMPGQVSPAVVRQRMAQWQELDAALRQAHFSRAIGQFRTVVPLSDGKQGLTEDFLNVKLDHKPGPGLHRICIGDGG
jgi:threonylcarbamoyladenosine tRNA methylthiotransferase MtaB